MGAAVRWRRGAGRGLVHQREDAALAAVGGLAGDRLDLEALYRRHRRDVQVIDELVCKMDGEGYFTARLGQVVLVDLARALALEGNVTAPAGQRTLGPLDHAEVAWAGDGSALYATSHRGEDDEREPWRRAICGLPAAGGVAVRLAPRHLAPGLDRALGLTLVAAGLGSGRSGLA